MVVNGFENISKPALISIPQMSLPLSFFLFFLIIAVSLLSSMVLFWLQFMLPYALRL